MVLEYSRSWRGAFRGDEKFPAIVWKSFLNFEVRFYNNTNLYVTSLYPSPPSDPAPANTIHTH